MPLFSTSGHRAHIPIPDIPHWKAVFHGRWGSNADRCAASMGGV